MKITYLNREDSDKYITSLLKPVKECLDIGCGIRPQTFLVPSYMHHICDPHEPYLEIAKTKRLRDGNINVASWEGVLNLYQSNSVDTVFLLDVIEHLEKEQGEKLLQATVDLATTQVLIFTPYGFMEQKLLIGPDAWGMTTGANELQVHRSGWLPEDFEHIEGAEVFICKDYHQLNHLLEPLPNGPHGAMWILVNK